MAFATEADVAARLGRDLTADETTMADALIASATSLIADAAGRNDAWAAALTPIPDVLKHITVEVAFRALVNPTGASSVTDQLGALQHSEAWPDAPGLELTAGERRRVRRTVNGSLTSVTLEGPFSETTTADWLLGS